jgi:type VI secretion system protein ImpG
MAENARFFWHASRERSVRENDKGTDLTLNLVDLDFQPVRPEAEVLSLEVTCSNRDLPEQIPFGGSAAATHTDFSLPGHSVVKRARALRKPTASQRLPNKRGLQWRLVSHLSLNYLSIVEGGKDALQEILSLYNFSDSQANARQVQGIVGISSQPGVTRVASRDFSGYVRGTELTLTLDEEYYVGVGMYQFASVLERFFALYCTPNSFIRLHLRSRQQTEEIAVWKPRTGEAIVI